MRVKSSRFRDVARFFLATLSRTELALGVLLLDLLVLSTGCSAALLIAWAGEARAQGDATSMAAYHPLSDGAAAKKVVPSPWEPRPLNQVANHTVPTPADLAAIMALPNLNSDVEIIHQVTGSYTGTTDEILQWGAAKWGFPADLVRAMAVQESKWRQSVEGDCKHDSLYCAGKGTVENGDSWGILQIKQASYRIPARLSNGQACEDRGEGTNSLTGCYPLSHLSTAFNVDYKLMWQRSCMNKSLTYLNQQVPIGGHPKYADATGDELLWGCVGAWFHGWYYAQDTLDYIAGVRAIMAARDWSKPGF